jgi:drug/metabolite transporter (DMT)-like permease
MPSDKLKNQLHLHFIVFIWGFTAILGALISIDAMPLVWYRVLIAAITLFIYLKLKKIPLRENFSDYTKFTIGGILIALHWTTFFYAIKISNISTTLITLSSSAVFLVLLQPLFSKKKFSFTELFLSIITIIGFVIIFKSEKLYTNGIIFGLISAFLLAIFSMYNNKLIQRYEARKIAFYELSAAFLFMSIVLFFTGEFNTGYLVLTKSDWFYITILATLCTAYPFVIATNLLRKMGPFTIILTNNLEPVYGIILAVIIFGDKEKMSFQFYIGAILIICSVLLNTLIKNKLRFGK